MSWQLGSMALVLAALAAGFLWYERGRPSSKLLALVAALAAMAVAGRVVLAPIPNVQATTDVVLLTGFALGAGPGFMVGAVGALASNFFLGQGPWTPWQMLGWGGIGLAGAALGLLRLRGVAQRWSLAVVCALAGFAFGAWMDLFVLLNFAAERSGDSYLAIATVSLPFNLAHAIGNALLALALGPAFVRMLDRYRRRFSVDWRPAPAAGARALPGAGSAAAVLALVIATGLLVAPQADAAGGRAAALRYLTRAQNSDGGFGGAPGQASGQLLTGWAVIGLEAAGRNPLDVRRGGRSPIDFMRSQVKGMTDPGELERTIIALRGAGISPRSFGGRDLVADLLCHQRPDGSFDGYMNWAVFGVLALRSAGRSPKSPPVRRALKFMRDEQTDRGGFSFSDRRGAPDVDDTGSALQALASVGRARSSAGRRALRFLRGQQNADGGFGLLPGQKSNAQSTAWAVQGLVAAGRDPARVRRRGGRSALSYLSSLQQPNGSFRYSRTSAQTPVWVTAQALAAIERRVLPLRPAPRAKRSARRPTVAHKGASVQRSPHAGSSTKSSQQQSPRGAAGTPAAAGPGTTESAGSAGSPAQTIAATNTSLRRSEPAQNDSPAPWAAGAAALLATVLGAGWLLRRRRS